MLNISKDEKRYSEIELDLHKKLAYEKGRASMIEELEKIKAEFENIWIKSAKDLRTGEVIYENLCEHSEVLEIIDKHIAELKGENK